MKILALIVFSEKLLFGQFFAEDSAKIGKFNIRATVAQLPGKTSAQSFEQIIPGDKPIYIATLASPYQFHHSTVNTQIADVS